MNLVFDTNIIHKDFYLKGPRITKLCSAADNLGYKLMVPDVVIDEMVNQYRKKMLQHLSGYSEVLSMLSHIKGIDNRFNSDGFLKDKVSEYESFLRKRIKELGITVIDYPKVDLKTLVSKELNVKKPYREYKDEIIGYRDSLIWESVKSVCKLPQALIEDTQIEFLTENTRDFAGTDKKLHSDLVLELSNAGFAENCVTLVPNVEEFFKNRIDPELEELEQIKDSILKSGKFNRFNASEELSKALNQDYINVVINESDFDSGERCYLPRYIEDPTINFVNEPVLNDVSVRQLSDQTVLVEIMAKVSIDMDYFIYKPDYCICDDEQNTFIIDDDWNDYYMLCEGSAIIYATVSFHTTAKLGKILSVDVLVNEVDI